MQYIRSRRRQTWIAVTLVLILYVIPSSIIPRSVPIYILSGMMAAAVLFRKDFISGVSFLGLALSLILTALLRVPNFTLTAVLTISYDYMFNVFRKAISWSVVSRAVMLGGFSLVLQLVYYNIAGDGEVRTGLGTDVNFSGLRIFLYFILCCSLGLRTGWLVAILGIFFTQSRLLVVLILAFFAIKAFLDVGGKIRVRRLLIWLFPMFIISLNIAIMALSVWAIKEASFTHNSTSSIIDRITNLNDQSNFGRALANVVWSERLLQGEFFFNTFDLEGLDATQGDLKPHNSLLYSAITQTIFYSTFALLAVWVVLLRAKDNYTVALIFAYTIGGCFIHGLYSPVFLFELFFVSAVSEAKSSGVRIGNRWVSA